MPKLSLEMERSRRVGRMLLLAQDLESLPEDYRPSPQEVEQAKALLARFVPLAQKWTATEEEASPPAKDKALKSKDK